MASAFRNIGSFCIKPAKQVQLIQQISQQIQMSECSLAKYLLPSANNQQKLEVSVNTATTSNIGPGLKPSLLNCFSSISIEGIEKKSLPRSKRKLFLKFLSMPICGLNLDSQHDLLTRMKKAYTQVADKSEGRLVGQLIPPITCVSGQSCPDLVEVLDYFCGAWLYDMGYKTEKNKKMIIEKVRLAIPDAQIDKAVFFYEFFGAGLLCPSARWELIVQTCKNGWQYFTARLLQFCSNCSQLPALLSLYGNFKNKQL